MTKYLIDNSIYPPVTDMNSYLKIHSAAFVKEPFDLHVRRPLGRRDHHILYVVSGVCKVFDEENTLLKSGDAYYFPPHAPQEYEKAEASVGFWIHFTGYGAENLCAQLSLTAPQKIVVPDKKRFEELFSLIVSTVATKSSFYEIESAALLMQLLVALGKHVVRHTASESLVHKVVLQMQKDVRQKFDMQKYADLCCLSVSRFSFVFKRATGVPPSRFFTTLKMTQAQYLLKNTEEKIESIASYLGYDDKFHFSSVFKKTIGISPNSYRKQ